MGDLVKIERIVNQKLFDGIFGLLKFLREETGVEVFCAGSAALACVGGPRPSDIDIFIFERVQKVGNEELHWSSDRVLATATLPPKLSSAYVSFYKVQLIYWDKEKGDPLDQFDFTVTRFLINSLGELHGDPDGLVDMHNKRLVLHAVPYPIATLERSTKYIMRGFRPCSGFYWRIIQEIRGMDDKEVTQSFREYNNGRIRAPIRVD